jgi:hypothetical protein
MLVPPRTAPIDASIHFLVWLYRIKPHENNRKKVRCICDGSSLDGQTMVHGYTYDSTPQQIEFSIKMVLAANIGMYLWHADVLNTCAEAERPKQMYYMRCDKVFREWWKWKNPTTPLPPDAVAPVLKKLQGHPEGPRILYVRCNGILVNLKFKAMMHALCLYHGTFNNYLVLFLCMVDD